MADDLGVLYTDRQLRDIERSISRLYSQAEKDIEKKLSDFSDRMSKLENKYLDQVSNGTMTQEAFDKWKSGSVFRGKQWTNKMEQISSVLADTNNAANNLIRGKQFGAFAMNANYAAYQLEHGAGTAFGFTLYDQTSVARLVKDKPNILPFKKLDKEKDVKWNFKNIRGQITQGILQGESIPKIAKRLSEAVPNRNAKQMVLHARTAMTSAQNGGRQERYREAEELGIKFKKVWLATLDSRTRDSHADLDGQAVEPEEDFEVEVDGRKISLSFPGDPYAQPEMTYNCRCTMITKLDDYPSSFNRRETESGEVIEDMTYREWEASKKREKEHEENQRASTVGLVRPERPRKRDYNDDVFSEEYQNAVSEYREQREQFNQRISEIKNEWLNEEKTYTSKEDVLEWGKRNNVTVTQEFLDNVDPKLYDDILKTESEMFERFPEVKQNQDSYLQWGLYYTPQEQADYFMEASAGLNVNGKYFSNAEEAFGFAIESQVDGFTTLGDGTLQTLVRHEFGHEADFYCREKFTTLNSTYEDHVSGKEQRRHEARDRYNKELIDLTTQYGSEYSRVNTAEAFAEGFSEYTSNPTSDYGKAFGSFFERWYYASPIE